MYDKKIIIILSLAAFFFTLGCLITINPTVTKYAQIDNVRTYSLGYQYTSGYDGTQNVTLEIKTSDGRIGLSWDENGTYQQSISKTEEVGKNYPNSRKFYVRVINTPIPQGEYKISYVFKGDQSGEIAETTTLSVSYQ